MEKIVKRDGREAIFNRDKIEEAILKAFVSVDGDVSEYAEEKAEKIADFIEEAAIETEEPYTVEEIQDMVEKGLMATKRKDVAKAYILYRNKRTATRENTIDKVVDEITERTNDYWYTENSNKNADLETTVRDYIAGQVSTDKARRQLLPEDVVKAHDQGIIHFHDMDYFIQHIHNCCLVNLEDMLQNGTVINGKKIDKPHKFSTACTIATQIIAQVASSQYGGQSISMAHLSPFIEETRKTEKIKHPSFTEEQIEELVKENIADGIQTIQYQVETLMTTNGQAPFITVYMDLGEAEEGQPREDLATAIAEILNQRIKGVKNEKGVYITPAFPKLIYALDDYNMKGGKYWWLTELSAKCSAKRMVPDYISNKVQRELKQGDTYTCMGCRSFLTVDRFSKRKGNLSNALNFKEDKPKYYGRFNQGVVTINLPYIALLSKKDMNSFCKYLNKYLEICHTALRCRHDRLLGTHSDVAPILWQYGALARLDKGETIDKLLYDGYSTISLGYAGLYECTKYMTGSSHTGAGKDFALTVMNILNDKCNEWKEKENIDYSVYGTPLESTTYKFAKALKKDFGEVKDVSDHDYITNSYHVCVREEIDAFTKLKFESEFQKLSPGGAISYVEIPNMQKNISAVYDIIEFIYNNIMYAELNTKSDYCQVCGWDEEIEIEEVNHKLIWKCPQCGNTDQSKMNVCRRTCGYLGTNFWNQGRTEEIKDRVLHIGQPDYLASK